MRYGNIDYLLAGRLCYLLGVNNEEELTAAVNTDFLFILENHGVTKVVYGKYSEHSVKLSQLIADTNSASEV